VVFRQLIVVLLGARAITAPKRAQSCPWPQPLSSGGRASDRGSLGSPAMRTLARTVTSPVA